MKNMTAFLIGAMAIGFAAAAQAETTYATSTGNQRYHQNVPSTPIWKNRDFWQNEKERSGLPEFWGNTKNFFRNLNPSGWMGEQRRKYDQRRATAPEDRLNSASNANASGTVNTVSTRTGSDRSFSEVETMTESERARAAETLPRADSYPR